MSTVATGQFGQKQAELYLLSNGYKIIETNYKTKIGEIDIIARDREQMVFIEVKYRRFANFGQGFESVGPRKLLKISKVAEQYLKNHKINASCRIDVVSIDGGLIRLFKNASVI